MSRRLPSVLVAVLLAGCAGAEAAGGTADELFAGDAVLQLHLVLDDDAVAALDAEPKEFVRGEVRAFGRTWQDVGIRFKGNRSLRGWDDKPAFKLHFGKYDDDGRFFGLEKLALNSMVEDPTMLRETLAYELHRAAGVPAPRTAYAQVFVNRELHGLYLIVEPADQHTEGNLYEGNYGCDLYPDDVWGFDQDGGDDESRADLAALAITATSPELLFGNESPLDLPRVLAYLAVSAYVGDFDGYRHGHNYRLHHDPARGWALLPWGLDRTFRKRLGVHDSGGLLARRCFADEACRAAYARELERVVGLAAALPARLEETAAMIDAAVRTDPRRPFAIQEVEERRGELRAFLARRPGEVLAELAAPPAPPPELACTELEAGGATFALCDHAVTWAEARDACAARGMILARLDDDAQSRAIGAHANKTKRWIGLTDRPAEDDFRWLDGSPATFTAWARGEPDNDSCNQDCAALSSRGTGRWHDTHCASRLPFVCRKD